MPRRPQRSLNDYLSWMRDSGFHPQTVIDVGVCHGTPELQNGFPEAYHILIEPLAELEPRMIELLRNRQGEYHMLALGSERGRFPFRVVAGMIEGATLATTASPAPKPHHREVTVERFDHLLLGRRLERPILLKTDCQGYDLAVLQGAGQRLNEIDVIVMEVNLFHPAGQRQLPYFGQIVTWMAAQGFDVHDIISYQTRPFDEALGYVDLAFVRQDGHFRAHHRWA